MNKYKTWILDWLTTHEAPGFSEFLRVLPTTDWTNEYKCPIHFSINFQNNRNDSCRISSSSTHWILRDCNYNQNGSSTSPVVLSSPWFGFRWPGTTHCRNGTGCNPQNLNAFILLNSYHVLCERPTNIPAFLAEYVDKRKRGLIPAPTDVTLDPAAASANRKRRHKLRFQFCRWMLSLSTSHA